MSACSYVNTIYVNFDDCLPLLAASAIFCGLGDIDAMLANIF